MADSCDLSAPAFAEVDVNDRGKRIGVWPPPAWSGRAEGLAFDLVVPMDRPGWFLTLQSIDETEAR